MLANLKALRTAQGLSQRALADFVKVSQQSINQYENRDTEPDIAVLTRIADYFGVSIDYLVGHDPAAGELIPTKWRGEWRAPPCWRKCCSTCRCSDTAPS